MLNTAILLCHSRSQGVLGRFEVLLGYRYTVQRVKQEGGQSEPTHTTPTQSAAAAAVVFNACSDVHTAHSKDTGELVTQHRYRIEMQRHVRARTAGVIGRSHMYV